MTSSISPLQKIRLEYKPQLPSLLLKLEEISFAKKNAVKVADPMLQKLFPHTISVPLVIGKQGGKRVCKAMRVGVVLSGGQASGGHNVIAGLYDALVSLNPASKLFGFLDGPSGIVSGKCKEITLEELSSYRNMGGFDLLGSGRTKIETPDQLSASLQTMKNLQLDGLVVIGGDDSNTNAAVLAEYFLANGSQVKVVGVPKTIDGDLQNEHVAISFGFDSACKVYSELISNIARDALSAKKYYHFIKLMGRSASHITLECALSTHANYAIIAEEVAEKKKTLASITKELADCIVRRAEMGKNYGVILIPEGLIEFIPEISVLIKELNNILAKEPSIELSSIMQKLSPASQACFASFPELIQRQMLLGRDPHGNVQLSLIETEKLLIETVSKELEARAKASQYKGKFNPLQHFFGYEGRAGFPSNFDAHYCTSLGYSAALLLDEGLTGMMCFVSNLTRPTSEWQIGGVPLTSLMNIEVRHGKEKPVIKKALVDLQAKPFIYFSKHRETWSLKDEYRFCGPTQYFGDASIAQNAPLSLQNL